MKYIKNYENYEEYEEYPVTKNPEDAPKSVPGFEHGLIDPDDNELYDFGEKISDAESYKNFLKIVKERNFEETESEIKINLYQIGQDYYMSIYHPNKHINKFLNDELIGKYISNGFSDFMNEITIEGIIEKVDVRYYNHGSAFFDLTIKDKFTTADDTLCDRTIIIDKLKSLTNKFNI